MARPVKQRRICELPKYIEFVSCGRREAEEINMTIDEYETIRLIDYMGLSQDECSIQMNVARTTVQSIYDTARRKLSDYLVNGKRLKIDGGTYQLCPKAEGCCGKSCGKSCGYHNCQNRKCEG